MTPIMHIAEAVAEALREGVRDKHELRQIAITTAHKYEAGGSPVAVEFTMAMVEISLAVRGA